MTKRYPRLEQAILKELSDEMDAHVGESLERKSRVTFGPDTGERAVDVGDGYMAVDTEYGLMEIRDGHVYLDDVDVGELSLVAKDEADRETVEFLTKFLRWMSRTK